MCNQRKKMYSCNRDLSSLDNSYKKLYYGRSTVQRLTMEKAQTRMHAYIPANEPYFGTLRRESRERSVNFVPRVCFPFLQRNKKWTRSPWRSHRWHKRPYKFTYEGSQKDLVKRADSRIHINKLNAGKKTKHKVIESYVNCQLWLPCKIRLLLQSTLYFVGFMYRSVNTEVEGLMKSRLVKMKRWLKLWKTPTKVKIHLFWPFGYQKGEPSSLSCDRYSRVGAETSK